MNNRFFILLSLFFGLAACVQTAKESGDSNNVQEQESTIIAEGKELFKIQCAACHNPEAKGDNRLAPPPHAIKKHYQKDNEDLSSFTKEMIAFLNEPSEEKAKMKHAIEKFNLMPKMNYQEEDLQKIAAYIYGTEFEKGHGKGKHKQKRKKAEVGSDEYYLKKGKQLALGTKKVLGKNLIGAINAKGSEGALEFCSAKAIHLTDSMANELKASIKRVSDQNRNPDNVASESELAYIMESKARLKDGKDPKPQLLKEGDKYIGYYPILTNQMCLQCHGKPNVDINETTLGKIKKHYPNDKAVGYGLNELRGIWVIEMDAEKESEI